MTRLDGALGLLVAEGGFVHQEIGAPRRGVIPQSVRTSPGGYRSFNYWRGGK